MPAYRVILLVLVTLLFQGCVKNSNTWIRDRAEDYKHCTAQAPLKTPEAFKTTPHSDRYHID
ncbi:MAG: hypothetical protein RLZ35_493 [Pseudomonadota bacterium]